MTAKPPSETTIDPVLIAKVLTVVNKLALKVFNSKTPEECSFIIVNDTIQVIHYDRALLWDLQGKIPKIIAVSGQTKVNQNTALSEKWRNLFKNIREPNKPQMLESEVFSLDSNIEGQVVKPTKASVIWLPIPIDKKPGLGLWLENWQTAEGGLPKGSNVAINIMMETLIPAYGSTWEKLTHPFSLRKLAGISKQQFTLFLLALFFLSVFIRVPLRIVAPCEVAPKDPILVTAPLEGIIEQIIVKPGEEVTKDEILFEYDKRVPLQQLKVAQKNVEITQADVDRSITLGLANNESLKELGVLELKLQKAKLDLDLAEYQAGRLTVKAPSEGIVMIQNPDEWRGKPVKVGERVLSINNEQSTKILIWIPEDDNIIFNMKEPIRIFLNINPERSHDAKLTYVSDYSTISEKQLPSFLAEAQWVEQPKDIKLGLKGTAILYGENVSLLYFVLRKPWAIFRHYVGF